MTAVAQKKHFPREDSGRFHSISLTTRANEALRAFHQDIVRCGLGVVPQECVPPRDAQAKGTQVTLSTVLEVAIAVARETIALEQARK